MRVFLPLLLLPGLMVSCSADKQPDREIRTVDGVPFTSLYVKQLPDLIVARAGHVLTYVEGRLTAFGGHTRGFVRTATAEYFEDGRWHLMNMTYPHDMGAEAVLPDGRIMLLGGLGEDLGVGASWNMEIYTPADHGFTPVVGTLDRRRAMSSAVCLADGKVLLSGNWYGDDALAVWDGEGDFEEIQSVSEARSNPCIFPFTDGDALVFSRFDNYGRLNGKRVDRLHGESFSPALLQEWHMLFDHQIPFLEENYRIKEDTWLFPAFNHDTTEFALIRVDTSGFSLLRTAHPLPLKTPDNTSVVWCGPLLADRSRGCAWLYGRDEGNLSCFLRVDYAHPDAEGAAPIGVWYAPGDGPVNPNLPSLALGPDGTLAKVGGLGGQYANHFFPLASASLYSTEPFPAEQRKRGWWVVATGVLLAGGVVLLLIRRRKRVPPPEEPVTDMATRIRSLMEEKELFRDPGFRVEDLAAELGTNVAYVRGCISGFYGGSFKDFVTEYRIRYVQRLLREHPDAKIITLAEEAGFTSSATFYRQFSASTGLSPTDWVRQQTGRNR